MATVFRRIGVLTSGGDAPGMNNIIRAVTRSGIAHGVEIIGINGGFSGLINDDIKHLGARDVSNILNEGGTLLYSARCPEFKTQEGMDKAVETCKKYNIDGIVAVGGDGTFRGAADLSNLGIPTIGIPGTIDCDITSTDYTIGYDTALNTTMRMIDNLRDTCESHARCDVVEVMGNHAGGIAIQSAIACGAVATFIHEIPFDENACIEKIVKLRNQGNRSFIVVVSEGNPYYSEPFAKRIQDATGVETKFARLAHVVRGGSPSLRDRVTGTRMAEAAVDELLKGESNVVICERLGGIVAIDINYALVLDRMYKNTLKKGDMDKFSVDNIESMKQRCQEKTDYFKKLYEIMDEMSW